MDLDEDQNDLLNFLLQEEQLTSLDKERNNAGQDFNYVNINTKIPSGYRSMPKKSAILARGRKLNEVADCKVRLVLELINFPKPKGTLCLFQASVKSRSISPVSYFIFNTIFIDFMTI